LNELIKEDEKLAEQANIRFIHTPKARKRAETKETSGMMLKAAAPVFGYDGKLSGVLYGGNLLNRNYKEIGTGRPNMQVFKRECKTIRAIGMLSYFIRMLIKIGV